MVRWEWTRASANVCAGCSCLWLIAHIGAGSRQQASMPRLKRARACTLHTQRTHPRNSKRHTIMVCVCVWVYGNRRMTEQHQQVFGVFVAPICFCCLPSQSYRTAASQHRHLLFVFCVATACVAVFMCCERAQWYDGTRPTAGHNRIQRLLFIRNTEKKTLVLDVSIDRTDQTAGWFFRFMEFWVPTDLLFFFCSSFLICFYIVYCCTLLIVVLHSVFCMRAQTYCFDLPESRVVVCAKKKKKTACDMRYLRDHKTISSLSNGQSSTVIYCSDLCVLIDVYHFENILLHFMFIRTQF